MRYACPSGHVVELDDDVVLPGRLSIGSHGYAQLTGVEKGTVVLLHRWLVGLAKGDPREVDHIDRDKLNYRRSNLRVVTRAENRQNFRRGRMNAYPTRTGRWSAQVGHEGRTMHLGTFDTQEEAQQAATRWRLSAGLPV